MPTTPAHKHTQAREQQHVGSVFALHKHVHNPMQQQALKLPQILEVNLQQKQHAGTPDACCQHPSSCCIFLIATRVYYPSKRYACAATHSLHNSCHNHQHDLRYHDHRTQWTTRNPGGEACRYCSINSQPKAHANVFRTITPIAGSAAAVAAAAAGLTAAPAHPAILGPTPRWSVPCVALQRFPATASTAAADAAEH
jgi:hypothetical protein